MRMLSEGALRGLLYIHRYRYLTIPQFARVASFSDYHSAEVLRTLEGRGQLGHFGFFTIPGQGRTPKVYYLKKKGYELLTREVEEVGKFVSLDDITWTPQTYHRLKLIDMCLSLEAAVTKRPHLQLVKIFLEYRGRETTDFLAEPHTSINRLVPDGAFILENTETGNRGLFFIEIDMGTERIVTQNRHEHHQTVHFKLSQYDRYLQSGNFATTYAEHGQFRSFILLFITQGYERIEHIRRAVADLPSKLHSYYRFTTFADAQMDFFGSVWKSRAISDTLKYPLVKT